MTKKRNKKLFLNLIDKKISKWEKERDDGRGYIDDKIRVFIDHGILKDLKELRKKYIEKHN